MSDDRIEMICSAVVLIMAMLCLAYCSASHGVTKP